MKVMLVDDSLTMRRIQKNQLATLGIKDIAEAENGKEGLNMLKADQIDFILLDWNMPVMDGMEFLKTVRQNDQWSKVKIIMCTSESEKPKVIEALKAGANNYLVKPFTAEGLKEKLGLGK